MYYFNKNLQNLLLKKAVPPQSRQQTVFWRFLLRVATPQMAKLFSRKLAHPNINENRESIRVLAQPNLTEIWGSTGVLASSNLTENEHVLIVLSASINLRGADLGIRFRN